MSDRRVEKRKYGEGYQFQYGEHWRLTIDHPVFTTTTWETDATNYTPAETRSDRREDKVRIHRPTLRELLPYVKQAFAAGEDFTVEHMADGRGDPRGYTPMSHPDLIALIRDAAA